MSKGLRRSRKRRRILSRLHARPPLILPGCPEPHGRDAGRDRGSDALARRWVKTDPGLPFGVAMGCNIAERRKEDAENGHSGERIPAG